MYFSGRIRGFSFDTYSGVMVDLFEVNLKILWILSYDPVPGVNSQECTH